MDILDFPQELLSAVLSLLSPADLVKFGRTCRRAQAFINPGNQILWRTAFLLVFDDPQDAWSMMPESAPVTGKENWDWYRELRRRLRALQAIHSQWPTLDDEELVTDYLEAILSIVDTAKFGPTAREKAQGRLPEVDDRSSLNLQRLGAMNEYQPGLEALIHDSGRSRSSAGSGAESTTWYSPGRPVTRSMTWSESEKQQRPDSASRLHVLHGLTARERLEHKAWGAARRIAYDWHLIGPQSDYGPFLKDGSGRVNWRLLEGVCSVIGRNFSMCVEGHIAMPQGFCFSIPHRTLVDPTVPEDWARVTGPWLGTYSFLDYADLLAFNTWDNHLGPRPTLDDEPEVCGDLSKLDLKLDNGIKNDPRLKSRLPVCTDLPPLFFTGLSRGHGGMHRPVIGVRGCVSLVPGAREVRWRFIINYGGQDQWQLEGVQPGGIRSGGVFGVWSHCEHEENGPVGPFCYFPMELCKPTAVVLLG